jgi:hypothetical protein
VEVAAVALPMPAERELRVVGQALDEALDAGQLVGTGERPNRMPSSSGAPVLALSREYSTRAATNSS